MKGSPVRVRASALCDLQGFLRLDGALVKGFRGPPEVYGVKALKKMIDSAGLFFHDWDARQSQGCHLQSPRARSSPD